MAKYQNTHKIIQWNCCGYKANDNKLQLLMTEQNPTIICLQETFKKKAMIKHTWKMMSNTTTYMTRA